LNKSAFKLPLPKRLDYRNEKDNSEQITLRKQTISDQHTQAQADDMVQSEKSSSDDEKAPSPNSKVAQPYKNLPEDA